MRDARARPAPDLDGSCCPRNVGSVEIVDGSMDTASRPPSLIDVENARGMTTPCEMPQTLTSGAPTPVLGCRRLTAATEREAILSIANRSGRGFRLGPKVGEND